MTQEHISEQQSRQLFNERMETVRNCRNHEMSSKEDESQSAEPAENQSKTRVRLNSFGKIRPIFSHDADRPAEIHSDDSQRDAHIGERMVVMHKTIPPKNYDDEEKEG
ncbi:hypothetical protein G5714_021049 [Onychostoma macrolepis]|uniref:Uncharacterized protein n=1 Tax=Onychostoma macrolepis TaxID=369639 RepID=A0A7J6BVK7_9TELE|nr:hypothetical protein G5714_021049 [Onychostoma macrolepis]